MHVLETGKIKYFTYLQFTYKKQTKKHLFGNFGNYSNGIFCNHLTANGCQNAKFCDIVEIWKKLKNGSFFSWNLCQKSLLNSNNENTENDEVAFLAGCLSKNRRLCNLNLPLLRCLWSILRTLMKVNTWCLRS